MKHALGLSGILLALGACVAASWLAIRPPLAPFLVPGATDIQVVTLGWNEWQISYHAPGSIATWSTDIGRNQETDHWSSPDYGYGALSRSYTRASSLAFCALWEWAFLSFDPAKPHVAQIRVRRWIAIPWGQFP